MYFFLIKLNLIYAKLQLKTGCEIIYYLFFELPWVNFVQDMTNGQNVITKSSSVS